MLSSNFSESNLESSSGPESRAEESKSEDSKKYLARLTSQPIWVLMSLFSAFTAAYADAAKARWVWTGVAVICVVVCLWQWLTKTRDWRLTGAAGLACSCLAVIGFSDWEPNAEPSSTILKYIYSGSIHIRVPPGKEVPPGKTRGEKPTPPPPPTNDWLPTPVIVFPIVASCAQGAFCSAKTESEGKSLVDAHPIGGRTDSVASDRTNENSDARAALEFKIASASYVTPVKREEDEPQPVQGNTELYAEAVTEKALSGACSLSMPLNEISFDLDVAPILSSCAGCHAGSAYSYNQLIKSANTQSDNLERGASTPNLSSIKLSCKTNVSDTSDPHALPEAEFLIVQNWLENGLPMMRSGFEDR